MTSELGVRILSTVVLAGLSICSVSRASEPTSEVPPPIVAYAKLSNQVRFAAMASLRSECTAARASLRELRRRRYETAADKQKAVAKAQRTLDALLKRLDSIEDPFEPYYAPVDPRTFKVGTIGRINWRGYYQDEVGGSVLQIADNSNMLVELSWTAPNWEVRGDPGDQYTVQGFDVKSKIIWVRGLKTRALVKGDWPAPKEAMDVFEVRRSTTYPTSKGSNSVLLFELLDMTPYATLFTRATEARVWKDASGIHTFDAIFVKLERGKARLVGVDRKVTDVPLKQLSGSDQEFIRKQVREFREAAATVAP